MKNFFLKYWQIIVLVVLSGLVVWPLFVPGYFSHHDDLQVMRIFEMRKCLTDFQIPCRWVPDMGYGNGYPLFNFYGAYVYYLGAVLSFVLGYVGAAKAIFFIPLVAGGVGMYLLAKELFGKTPGLLAGALYLFAPYRALDAYVRGAVSELFAMAIVPFVILFIHKLIKTGKIKYFFLGAVLLSVFLLSHNIMTLIFSPVIFLLTFYFGYENKWKYIKKVIWLFVIGVGLSAFFLFPAFLEKGLVQTEALTRAELDFRAQFVKVGQLFVDKSWNYSGSNPNSEGTISYQIGWPQWWLVVLAPLALVFSRKRKDIRFLSLLLVIFAVSVFMTHNKSAPVWELIKILSFVQFPWRFLSIVIFVSSLIGAYLVSTLGGKKYLPMLIVLTLSLTVIFNWRYFRPEHFYKDVTDETKLSGQNFIDQQKGALLDYLPKTALEPKELAWDKPMVTLGSAQVSNFSKGSAGFRFEVVSTGDSIVEIPVLDFPNWETKLDGTPQAHEVSFPTGRIKMVIPEGTHRIEGKFGNTPIRTVSNLLTLISLFGLFILAKYGKNTKLFS